MRCRQWFSAGRLTGAAVGAGLLVAVWAVFGRHVTEPAGTVTPARAASFASIPVPASAINVRIAGYSQGIAFAQYVRFEAPADVCLRTAAAMAFGRPVRPTNDLALFPPSGSGVYSLEQEAFRHFDWFDLDRATDVVTVGGGPSVPQVWVDRQRGVFYYRNSD